MRGIKVKQSLKNGARKMEEEIMKSEIKKNSRFIKEKYRK